MMLRQLISGMAVLACLAGPLAAQAKKPAKPTLLDEAKLSMRAKAFDEAAKTLDKHLVVKKAAAPDEATYLKALALHYTGKHADAVKVADTLLATFPKSPWLRKARFLKATSLIELRQFKAAEAIYEDEANRLLSESRKRKIAGVIIGFAEALATKPDPNDIGAPPPNYPKAYNLYSKALAMEIGRDLRDKVMFAKARTVQLAGNHGQAINDYRAYLAEFDPDWTGNVGSATRLAGQKRENPKPAGKHPLEARRGLSEALLAGGDHNAARVNLEDLLKLVPVVDGREDPKTVQLRADVRWLLVCSYRLPNPAGNELERAVKEARDYLASHPSSPQSVVAAWWIAQAYQAHGRADQAIEAYEQFLAGAIYKLPAGDAATDNLAGMGKSPAQFQNEWRKLAVYSVGQIRYGQKNYTAAREAWQRYINKYPNGPQWSACQRGMIDAEFQVAIEAMAQKKYDDARKLFAAFSTKHPLDGRVRQILFTVGQIDYAAARKLEANKGNKALIAAAYRRAIDHWNRLVSKYPNTDESSLALYRIGVIHEEKLDELAKALDAYRRLTWGSYASQARARVAVMTRKHLLVQTEQKFRTNEAAEVKIDVRNIEKLKFKQYFLDLEAYFRKTHTIGKVDQLDIDLIQPDKTWEVEIDKYAKYKPLTQTVEIPFPKGKAGVCIVNIGEDDLEATTLVIRSDLDVIVKSSRREALVFVQDMRQAKPAAGVELLLSDGKKVFATGTTGDDGVYRGKLGQLSSSTDVRVFALRDGSIASNALGLSGLRLSKGLSAKGYIYTDRSAYQPGQTVKLRAIIRDVVDGSYVPPRAKGYHVVVTDAAGRMIWQKFCDLSEFGTLHTQTALDARAPLGRYTVTAESGGKRYSSTFEVQRFKLEKMRLTVETDRPVYFRGETIKLTIDAQYYWGQPVVDKPVRYRLPDGRQFVVKTNAEGKIEVSYDTTGLTPRRAMAFSASIEGENVQALGQAYLARLGFGVAVKPSVPLVMASEPFDVEVSTNAPDGKPVGKAMTLFVLRRQTPKADPVLIGVPWIKAPTAPAAEVTIEEHKAETNPKTGKATVKLKLKKGGQYILRASGEDRFEQVVTSQSIVNVSDDEDATKLRFFADTDTLQVGGKTAIRLHSRVDAKLALLTYEGETIIAHEVKAIKKGYNKIPLTVGHEHFPNFRVAVSVMDDRTLRAAAKSFRVQRQLNVTVKPIKDTYAPGQKAKVELTVNDQLGKPVVGELSLALIDEALFAAFPDRTPAILDFFQRDATRYAEFRLASTCAFSYAATTRTVVKAYKDEQQRLVRQALEGRELNELQAQLSAAGNFRRAPRATPPNLPTATSAIKPGTTRGSLFAADEKSIALNGTSAGREAGKKLDFYARGSRSSSAKSSSGSGRGRPGENSTAQPRREMPEAGRWLPAVVTDANGKAVVELPMPETTTQWRLTARGCTVETLVGQATANVITRKDFFVAIKTPQIFQEGDKVRVLARVHNLTAYAGPVELTLTLLGGDEMTGKLVERKTKTTIKANASTEALFEGVEIPLAAALKLQVTAKAGKLTDALATVVPVRPWGLEFADHSGGVATGDAAVTVQLPDKRTYASKWMTVTVGPDLKRAVIEMALRQRPRPLGRCIMPPPYPGGSFTGSDLLAVTSALRYAKAVGAPRSDYERLVASARSLASALVVSQRSDGGWSWTGGKGGTDWAVTAMSFWALSEANVQNVGVNPDTLAKARACLANTFTRLAATDNDAKAVVLHALSVGGGADFAHANRLHRERNALSPAALAYTAMTFANLKRNEFAGELLDVLGQKAVVGKLGPKPVTHWVATGKHAWMKDNVETTALAVMAMMRVRPTSAKIAPAINYLMNRRRGYGFAPAKAHGPAVGAIAAYYAAGKFAAADYKLTVLVNGKKLKTIAGKGASGAVELAVPAKLLAAGENLIEFSMAGRGQYSYAATIRGFSSDLTDPKSWTYPYPSGRYYRHTTLEYRGKPIGASSSSPVKNIEIGQRVRVNSEIHHYSNSRANWGYLTVEEHLPAGMMLVDGSLSGRHVHHEIHDGKIVMYFPAGHYPSGYSYELVGYATGEYRVLPTVIRDALNPGRMRVGGKADLVVLAPGAKSDDPYQINTSERYALANLYFRDGLYKQALEHLAVLFKTQRTYNERDVARMLLWIYTADGFYNAQQIVKVFEVLRERFPTLEIPYDKILLVGKAYRDLGEFERAYFVFRATIDASFINDSNVSAVLEDEGQFLGSIDYQQDLWREYPDTAEVTTAYFALSQALYQKAPKAHELAAQARQLARVKGLPEPENMPSKVEMLAETISLLNKFLTMYPTNPLADDAAFSKANAFLDLKQYQTVVKLCDAYKGRFTGGEFVSGFQYMTALGHFWQRDYKNALAAGHLVANGTSKDRDFARYILGQIYHAQGAPADAIDWYRKVSGKYPDAKQAIDYFEAKRVSLDEVNIFRPGKKVELTLKYRNVKEAFCQVYRVDLMKLYLREKNLTNITKVNLAGIAPLVEQTLELGDGKDYVDKERKTTLKLKDEGAYLVICRGDDLFASGLVLITPLKIEVQEDATSGRVRANVIDAVEGGYVSEVHVKAIGSADTAFRSGETDLRGIFVADNLRGKATVIARQGDARYAFHRGASWLGAPANRPTARPSRQPQPGQLDYQQNLRMQNSTMQRTNWQSYDSFRRSTNKGVQVQQAK